MIKRLILPLFFFLTLLSFPVAEAATPPPMTVKDPVPAYLQKISSLSLKEAQQLVGRKFTLKEKIGFWMIKKQVRKGQEKGFSKTQLYKALHQKKGKGDKSGTDGRTALGLGIGALALLILGLFVPFVLALSPIMAILAIVFGTIAKKKNPEDTNAALGKLLGWIALGLFVVLLIIVVIALSSWAWG